MQSCEKHARLFQQPLEAKNDRALTPSAPAMGAVSPGIDLDQDCPHEYSRMLRPHSLSPLLYKASHLVMIHDIGSDRRGGRRSRPMEERSQSLLLEQCREEAKQQDRKMPWYGRIEMNSSQRRRRGFRQHKALKSCSRKRMHLGLNSLGGETLCVCIRRKWQRFHGEMQAKKMQKRRRCKFVE